MAWVFKIYQTLGIVAGAAASGGDILAKMKG